MHSLQRPQTGRDHFEIESAVLMKTAEELLQ